MKKILLSVAVILLCFAAIFVYLGKTAIESKTGKTFAEKVATKIPENQKQILKNFFFKNEIMDLKKKINKIKDIKVEYLEIRNKKNLSKRFNKNNFKIFISYYNKKVRLIDNY